MTKIKNLFFWLKNNRKSIAAIFFIAYLVLSFFYIISYWNSIENREYFSTIRIKPLFAISSFAVQIAGFFLSIFIWQDVLRSYNLITEYWQDFRRCSYSLLTTIFPGKIFFHLGRMAFYHNDDVDGRVVGVAGISEAILIGIGSLALYTACYFIIPSVNLMVNPWISVILAVVSILSLTPFIFRKIILWTNRSISNNEAVNPIKYSFTKGVIWLIGEVFVVFLGGISLYLFLLTFIQIDINQILIFVAVWAAASASSSFLFWLPGSFLVRDGAMLLVLQKIIPNVQLAFSIIVLHRIWIIISISLFAFLTWLIFNLFKNLKQFH